MSHRTRNLGAALMELMVVLILLGVFMVISGQVFNSILHVTAESHDAPRPDREQESLIKQLRGDVWGAMEARVPNEGSLVLRYAGDKTVIWERSEGERFRRKSFIGQRVTEETECPAAGLTRVEAFGPGVRLSFAQGKHRPASTVDLYSQLVQLQGGTR